MVQRAALVVCVAAGREVDAVAQVRAAQHRLRNPGNYRVCVQQSPETGAHYASTREAAHCMECSPVPQPLKRSAKQACWAPYAIMVLLAKLGQSCPSEHSPSGVLHAYGEGPRSSAGLM